MHLDWLFERMAEQPDAPAVVWRQRATPYDELLRERARWDGVLEAESVGEGAVVALIADYTPQACALLLALIDRGTIVVPLTMATASQHDEFIEISQAEVVVRLDADGGVELTTLGARASHPLLTGLREARHPGLVVFSSGSTGKSKGMVHDFDRLLEKFRSRRAPLVTLTFLLFDHMGGLNTLLHTFANGGTVVATDERDPETVCSLIAAHGVELLPVSPTFLNLVMLSGAHERHDLSSLRLITYGTEVMPQATLDRVRAAIPSVEFRQTYGLSETGVLRTKTRDGGSLWLKVGGEGVETKVVDGTLWIRSRSAIQGYLNAPSPFDEDGWMNTQDRVETDGEYIKILGRVTDIINVGGNKVYPAEVETVLLELDNVEDATVYGEPNPLMGQVVAARLVLREDEPTRELMKRVRRHVSERLERFKVPARIEVADRTEVSVRYKKVRGPATTDAAESTE